MSLDLTLIVKIACPHCSARLVLKNDRQPAQVKCPKCGERFRPATVVTATATPSGEGDARRKKPAAAPADSPASEPAAAKPVWQPGGSSADLIRAVVRAFEGQTVHRAPTLRYRFTLLFTAVGLGLLIVAYLACVAGIGYGLYLYAKHFVPASFQVRVGRVMILVVLMHAGVAIAGVAILYSLVAPLFRRERHRPDGQLLPAVTHPVLHSFVSALCTLIAAPKPDEIRLGAVPNASAGRYGGFLGILGGTLVLDIGEPLFYGFDLPAMAGVIAHELGHFSQATSGWLFRYIATVSNWFQEATERTGGIQDVIGEEGSGAEGSMKVLVLVAYCITGLGRLLILQFALLSRIITFSLLRQMEFDADRYEAEVAGSAQFARTTERLSELEYAFNSVIKAAFRGELVNQSGLELPELIVEEANTLSDIDRRRVARRLAPKRAQWFDSHPSHTERIAAVAKNPQPCIFQLDGPALCLLNVLAVAREAHAASRRRSRES